MSNDNKNSDSDCEKEMEYLEDEFLKCTIDDIPFPKEEIKEYESEVLEVMKSGCNRQIAEYVILEYKKFEDEEVKTNENMKKLSQLREEYDEYKNAVINNAYQKFRDEIKNKDNKEAILEGYEYEIEEIIEKINGNEILKKNNVTLENPENYANYYLNEAIKGLNDNDKKRFEETRKAFTDKREAVIESALRRIKEIVNDDEEYKKFYKDYYGKEKV